MKLKIEGTPEELQEKRPQLLKALISEFRTLDPLLADILEKALPSREPQLKYRVLREIHDKTKDEYKKQLQKMTDDIEAVLKVPPIKQTQKPVPKSESMRKFQKALPGKATKQDVMYLYEPNTQYTCGECNMFIPDKQRCTIHKPSAIIRAHGSCGLYHPGKPMVGAKPHGKYGYEETGYAENEQGFSCKRCVHFLEGQQACAVVDKASEGTTPDIIHSDACCNAWVADPVKAKKQTKEFQKSTRPETQSEPINELLTNTQLYYELQDALTVVSGTIPFQKSGFEDAPEKEEPEPGAEPPDPDIDEESGEPIFDPVTGMTPTETQEAKERGGLDEEEPEEEEETALSVDALIDEATRIHDDLALQKAARRKSKKNPHGGPFVGPRGGLWADPKHTIHWDPAKHGKVPVKIQKQAEEKAHDPGDRYDDDAAMSALMEMGDLLHGQQAAAPTEQDETGFSRYDMDVWMGARGNLNKMRRLLFKYKRQLMGSKWWKAGVGDPIADQTISWKYHERFGSLNILVDGWIGSKDQWWEVHNYFKSLGMWRDRASGYYVLRDPAGFDFEAFQKQIQEILPGVQLPPAPPGKPHEVAPEEAKAATKEVIKQAGGSPVDAIWDGLRTGMIKNAVGMKWHEGDKTFEFRFPKGVISALFSNKRGMLPSITYWDQSTDPWNVKVFDVEIAKLAIERIKELKPDFLVATEGLEEAASKRSAEITKRQAPIPEIEKQLGIDPATDEPFTLRPFQNEGVRFLIKNDGNAMLGDEMGLGKTIQYLAYAVAAKRKAICVGPKSVRRNWIEEGAKFFPDYFRGKELDSAELLKAKRNLKKQLGRKPTMDELVDELGLRDRNLVTINYESVGKFEPLLSHMAKELGFDSMVVDESHRAKNPKAQLTKALQKVRQSVPHAILMSGTSIKNKKEEFATQVEMVRPGTFKMVERINPYNKRPYMVSELKNKTIGELWHRMRDFYLARSKDVVLKDLPPRETTIAHIEPDPEMTPDLASTPEKYVANARFGAYAMAKEDDLSEEEARDLGEAAGDEAGEELDEMMGSLADRGLSAEATRAKVAEAIFDKSVAAYTSTKFALAQAKVPETTKFVQEMLESTERNVLIFTESKAAIRRFKEEFGDLAEVHTGDQSHEERERVKALFHHAKRPEDTKARVLLLTTPSAREGITLTAADMVVFNDLPWTAADLQQAEARAHRIGQANKVNVYWMKAQDNDMDDIMTRIVQRKLHLSEKANKGRQILEDDRKWMDDDIKATDLIKELAGELFGRGGEAPKVSTKVKGKTVTTTAPPTPETAIATPESVTSSVTAPLSSGVKVKPKREPIKPIRKPVSEGGMPEAHERAAAAATGGTQENPSVAMTNEKAKPRLKALPKQIRSVMSGLHKLEGESRLARKTMTPREAKRIQDWIKDNGGELIAHDRITYSTPAGNLTWGYERISGQYTLSYSSQTEAVWEGPEPDRPAEPPGPKAKGAEGEGGLQAETGDLSADAQDQLPLFKSDLAKAILDGIDIEHAHYQSLQVDPQPLYQDHDKTSWSNPVSESVTSVKIDSRGSMAPFQKAGLADPLEYDHTKPIEEREGKKYEAVKQELIKRGAAKASDFDRGGLLYGRSNNELINFLESLRANNGGQ